MPYSVPRIILITCMALVLALQVNSQVVPFATGYVDKADLEMKSCPTEPDAAAMVLYDYGIARFVGRTRELEVLVRYHKQVKVLKKEGLAEADVQIVLESSGSSIERLVTVEAVTYNLVEGKVERSAIKKTDLLEQILPNGTHVLRFGMPNARVGSVLEIIYTISSPFIYHLPSWYFQGEYPVRSSEYTVIIPEYFDYKLGTSTYFDFSEVRQKQVQETYHFIELPDLKPQALSAYWRMENIPAFEREAFMGPSANYLAHLDFELASYKMPGAEISTVVSGDWSTFTKDALKQEKLGMLIEDSRALSDFIQQVTAGAITPEEKAKAIYHHLRSHLKWNGVSGLYADKKPKSIYQDGTGNIAELHVTLLAMLHGAGVEAWPVFVNTNGKGVNYADVPLIGDYDYLAVAVRDTGGYVFLDISDPDRAYGTLPQRCLGGQGVVLAEDGGKLVPLLQKEKFLEIFRAKVKVGNFARLEGTFTRELYGVAAEGYASEKEEERLPKLGAWDITLLQEKQGTIDQNKRTQEGMMGRDIAWDLVGDIVLVEPLLGMGFKENIFSAEERIYPIDIGFPIKYIYQVELEIPEGWAVEETMAPVYINLPGAAGRFRFLVSKEANTVTFSSTLSLELDRYGPEYYKGLRELFAAFVEKHSASILLKKLP